MRLSNEQRKIIPEEEFGLPDERKYYLGDKEHVIKAIVYFGACDPHKRQQLADNINIAAHGFNLKVNVSKTNPFYKYADAEILKENAEPVMETWTSLFNSGPISYYNGFDTNISKKRTLEVSDISKMIDLQSQIHLKTALAQVIDLADLENDVNDYEIDGWRELLTLSGEEFVKRLVDQIHMYNGVDIMKRATELIYRQFKSIFSSKLLSLLNSIQLTHSKNILDTSFENDDLGFMNSFNYITRNNDYFIDTSIKSYIPTNVNFDDLMLNEVLSWYKDQESGSIPNWCTDTYIQRIITNSGKLSNISYEVEKIKFYVKDMLDDGIIKAYFIDMDSDISPANIITPIFVQYQPDDKYPVKDSLYTILYITSLDSMVKVHLYPLNPDMKPFSITIKPIEGRELYTDLSKVPCTEGIHITKDGSVSWDISHSKNYMDKYSECHKMLVANDKVGNTESMKQNLAFMFSLITVIENKYMYDYKMDKNSNEYKDAIKARAFAMNDFKTYYKKLNQKEKNFDFSKYYTENGYDKSIYTLTTDTIKGIKKLLRTILIG